MVLLLNANNQMNEREIMYEQDVVELNAIYCLKSRNNIEAKVQDKLVDLACVSYSLPVDERWLEQRT